jgi:hypothetical protein
MLCARSAARRTRPTTLAAPGFISLMWCALAFSAARAELLVYEPFDYPAGSQLIGANGGAGFTSPWRNETVANSATIQNGSLSFPGLPTLGNSVLMTGQTNSLQIFRDHINIAGTDGTQTWISFIAQRLGPIQDPVVNPNNPYPRGVNISFYNTEGLAIHGREQFAVGNSSGAATNNVAFIGHGQNAFILPSTSPAVPFGGAPPAYIVIRIDHHGPPNVDGDGNNDDVYFFVNPDPLVEPLSSAANAQRLGTEASAFDYSGLDHLRPFIGNTSGASPYGELLWDELRIGTTYADVAAGSEVLLPGDTDEDGVPGEFPDDFIPIRDNFQKAVAARASGDLFNDDFVDFKDFRQWKTAFEAAGGSLANVDVGLLTQIPEPATAALLSPAIVVWHARNRRR